MSNFLTILSFYYNVLLSLAFKKEDVPSKAIGSKIANYAYDVYKINRFVVWFHYGFQCPTDEELR